MNNEVQNELISLCSKMIHTTIEEVKQDRHKRRCLNKYVQELTLIGGPIGCLQTFEACFCHPLMNPSVWSMQGIAYVYLAMYGHHTFGTIDGINLLDILLVPQKDDKGNLLKDGDNKVIKVITPNCAWFLKPEGINLWYTWVYAMFHPSVKRPSISSPTDLLSQLVYKKRLITEECNKNLSDIQSPEDSINIKESSWILEQCFKKSE